MENNYWDKLKQKKEKNSDGKYYWTNHSKEKMIFYGLSESLVKRVLRFPKRTEEGVAPETFASMKQNISSKNQYEIWVMYQLRKTVKKGKDLSSEYLNEILTNLSQLEQENIKRLKPQVVIISAWKYPGITKSKGEVPIPDDIRRVLRI